MAKKAAQDDASSDQSKDKPKPATRKPRGHTFGRLGKEVRK